MKHARVYFHLNIFQRRMKLIGDKKRVIWGALDFNGDKASTLKGLNEVICNSYEDVLS